MAGKLSSPGRPCIEDHALKVLIQPPCSFYLLSLGTWYDPKKEFISFRLVSWLGHSHVSHCLTFLCISAISIFHPSAVAKGLSVLSLQNILHWFIFYCFFFLAYSVLIMDSQPSCYFFFFTFFVLFIFRWGSTASCFKFSVLFWKTWFLPP